MEFRHCAIVLLSYTCFIVPSLVTGNTNVVPVTSQLTKLGTTFDYSKSIIGDRVIFKNDDLKKHTKTVKHYLTTSNFKVVKTNEDVRDVLDISGKLSLQIMSGAVKIAGEGKYLKESSTSTSFVEVLAKVTYQTETKTIVGTPTPKPHWKRLSTGKHYIRSLTYGGFLIASLRFQAKNKKDKELVEAKISANVQAGSGKVDAKAQFNKLAEAASDISTLSISYFGTATLPAIPTDIKSLIKAVEDFPKVMSSSYAIEAEIRPLTELEPQTEKLKFLLNSAAVISLNTLSSQYFDVITAKDKANKYLREHGSVHDVERFYSDVFNVKKVFDKMISSVDLEKSELQFQPAYDEYADKGKGNKLPGKFMREFNTLIAKDKIQRYATMLPPSPLGYEKNGILYLGANNSYSAVAQENEVNPRLQKAKMEAKSVMRQKTLTRYTFFSVYIKSVGCNDKGKDTGSCDYAHAYIQVNGEEYSKKKRGHNIVIVDPDTGMVLESKVFDTHHGSSSKDMKDYLNKLPQRRIVLVAIQDDGGSISDEAVASLKKLGAHSVLKAYRSSYGLIGWTGPGHFGASVQVQKKAGEGPSIISELIPLPMKI